MPQAIATGHGIVTCTAGLGGSCSSFTGQSCLICFSLTQSIFSLAAGFIGQLDCLGGITLAQSLFGLTNQVIGIAPGATCLLGTSSGSLGIIYGLAGGNILLALVGELGGLGIILGIIAP